MRTSIPLAEAKNKLSELVERVQSGEEVIITRHDKEVARLGPVNRLSKQDVREKIARFQALREQNVLNPSGAKEKLTIKDLVNEGRRF
jgi:prevent-host-death family protein